LAFLLIASVPASGDNWHFASPPPPVPKITLTQCLFNCFGASVEEAIGICRGLIEHNLFELKETYEVSAPTEGMACALDLTTQYLRDGAGASYSNPFGSEWNSEDVEYQIYVIEHEGDEIIDVGEQHEYTGWVLNKRLETLQQMQRARLRLIERFNALQDAFKNEVAWPKLVDVGPNVWPIAACVAANDPLLVPTQNAYDEFEKKVSTYAADPKLAPFAFFKDWYDLTSPGNQLEQRPARACGSDRDTVVTPFYAQPTANVQASKDNLLGTLYVTKSLTKRLIDLGGPLDEAEKRAQQARASFTRDLAIKVSATYDLAVTQTEAASMTYRRLLDEKREINKVASKEAELTSLLGSIDAWIPDASEKVAKLEADSDQAGSSSRAQQAAADQARENLDRARDAIGSVALQCAGRAYKDCSDAAAKETYDRALFNANSAYYDAMVASSAADEKLKQATDAEDSLRKSLLQSRRELSDLRKRRVETARAITELQSKKTQYDGTKVEDARDDFAALEISLGRLRTIASKYGVNLGAGIKPRDLKAQKRIFGKTSCPTDNVWAVYTDASGKQVGPIHLAAIPNSVESNYAPLAFVGDGMHPGGSRTELTTSEASIQVVALGTETFLLGDGIFHDAYKGDFFSLPLPEDTVTPYLLPGYSRYAKYNLLPAVVDGEDVWALDVNCP
jgi:hypothetical protein